MRVLFILLFFICSSSLFAQDNARLSGYVRSDKFESLSGVTLKVQNTKTSAQTDQFGFYSLTIPTSRATISFSKIGYRTLILEVGLVPGTINTQNVILSADLRSLQEVKVNSDKYNKDNALSLNSKLVQALPSVSGNFESLLKTLPGVSSNNELSSQYSVRGGNFDENLVYVNDIEIYRPLLVRNGQQEGLSFINPELVSQVTFSAGGFEARYGDKLSSVLNVSYLRPDSASIVASFGLLGNSATFKLPGQKHFVLAGIRLKNNQTILNRQDTKGSYQPRFSDYQFVYSGELNPKTSYSLITGYNSSTFDLAPESRETTFGTISETLRLQVSYQGRESDRYESLMGAFTMTFKPISTLNFKWITSAFKITEQERFDIEGRYTFDELETSLGNPDFGKVRANRGIGSNLDYARNKLRAEIYSTEIKSYKQYHRSFFESGVRFQFDHVQDELNEYRVIDSAGYILPLNQPEFQLTDLVLARNEVRTSRISGFLQTSSDISARITLSGGIRGNYSSFTRQFLVSPRITMAYRLTHSNDLLLRISAGAYHQQPFYREFRRFDGTLNRQAQAQKSWHFLSGADYLFDALGTQLKFSSELYYKHLNHLTPYKVENLRIRYLADQQSKGYAAGADFNLSGQFVANLESSFRLSLMKTSEDIANDHYQVRDESGNVSTVEPGYIKRPSDQRVNVSIFFQDRLLNSPSNKVHLTLLYGSALPVGPPGTERYRDVFKIPAYKRVDIGFSKDFMEKKERSKPIFLDKYFDSLVAYAEIFNMLNINNTISYLWIKDVNNNQYAVPNYLTSRQFNFRIIAKIRNN